MACCDEELCKDTWTDERRWRGEVINLLKCLLTTNVAKDTEILQLCDVQPDLSIVPFIRIVTINCDGTKTIEDFELDGTTPYVTTGDVTICGLGETDMLCLPPLTEFPLNPAINCIVNIVSYAGAGTVADGLYYWNGNQWVSFALD